MISFNEVKKRLNKGKRKYSDDEVKAIIDFLSNMAKIQILYEQLKAQENE